MIRVINGDTRSLDTKPYTIGLIKGDTRGLDYSSDVVLCFRGCQGRGRKPQLWFDGLPIALHIGDPIYCGREPKP